jgi:hypothetical protein
VDFPPVLQLQLKRFDFDYERGIMTKVRLVRVGSSTQSDGLEHCCKKQEGACTFSR